MAYSDFTIDQLQTVASQRTIASMDSISESVSRPSVNEGWAVFSILLFFLFVAIYFFPEVPDEEEG